MQAISQFTGPMTKFRIGNGIADTFIVDRTSDTRVMLTTHRLIIRPWEINDAASFLSLTKDAGFMAYLITDYRQKDIHSSETWIRAQKGKYAVLCKESGELIGMGGLTPWIWEEEQLVDITYRLKESAWGKGFGWELAKGLRDYGFQALNLSQITATITPKNVLSKKIAEKLGFRFDRQIILHGVLTDLFRLYRS
jgi:RimJ/RimL family protein N-acetyltransferase